MKFFKSFRVERTNEQEVISQDRPAQMWINNPDARCWRHQLLGVIRFHVIQKLCKAWWGVRPYLDAFHYSHCFASCDTHRDQDFGRQKLDLPPAYEHHAQPSKHSLNYLISDSIIDIHRLFRALWMFLGTSVVRCVPEIERLHCRSDLVHLPV